MARKIESHEILEWFAELFDQSSLSAVQKTWLLLAIKHLTRLGKKNEIDSELSKTENYLHRSRTGKWIRSLRPKHYGGELEKAE